MNNQIQNRRMLVCLWLVRTLQLHKQLTMAEIRQLWLNSTLSEGNPLPRQTFIDYRNAAEEFLGLEIACDRRTNKYYIAERDDSQLSNWLISSFSVGNLLSEQQTVRDRILLDAPPKGIEYFDMIIDAFRNSYALEMTYRKFSDSEPYTCHIEPYCLKHDQQRWYLLGRKDHRPYLQTFALDRIVSLEALHKESFCPEEDFSAQQYYAHSFGVFVGEMKPEPIRIRAFGIGRDYLRTAPLHASQKEETIDQNTSDFTLYCRPTRDLMLHLLGQGADVEIIEPQSLRESISEEIRKISNRYL